MAEELLDYSGREFSFEYADFVRAEQKIAFERDCEGIRDSARQVVADFCVLGKRLERLKKINAWTNVLDQNGERYNADNFTDFCAWAFGFSATRTSNLLGLARFVVEEDGEMFLDKPYEGFSTSKLIEISSTYAWQWNCFLPTWTVKQIRLVKNYIKVHSCSGVTPEYLLNAAMRLEEKREQAKQAAKNVEQKTLSSVQTPEKQNEEPKLGDFELHSFLATFEPFEGYRRRVCQFLDQRMTAESIGEFLKKDLSFGFRDSYPYYGQWGPEGFLLKHKLYGVERFMTWREFALEYAIAQTMGRFGTEGQRETWFEVEEPSENATDLDAENEIVEIDEDHFLHLDVQSTVDRRDITEPITINADASEAEERYDLKTREGRREWMRDYQNWQSVVDAKSLCLCATAAYQYVVCALNLVVFAVESSVLNRAFESIATSVDYYASIGEDSAFVNVQKDRLEKYIADGLKSL